MLGYEEFSFDSSVNGQKIFTRKYIPQNEIKAVVHIVHGMAEHGVVYDAFCKFLAENDYLVYIFDNLGHGKSVVSGADFGYFFPGGLDNIVADIRLLYKEINKEYSDIPYFLLGHSMGSFLVRDYMTKYGSELSGAIIVGTSCGQSSRKWFLSRQVLKNAVLRHGEKGKSKSIEKSMSNSFLKGIKNPKTQNDWLTFNEEEVTRYTLDPMCGFPLTVSGYLAMGHMLQRVNDAQWYKDTPKDLPILMLSGALDPVGGMGVGVRKVASKLVKSEHNCELILYPNMRHAILTENDREKVFFDIKNFLDYKTLRAKNKL